MTFLKYYQIVIIKYCRAAAISAIADTDTGADTTRPVDICYAYASPSPWSLVCLGLSCSLLVSCVD
jgi:hypothetical protein